MTTARIADAALGLRHVFIRDLVLSAHVGIHPREHRDRQRIRINLDIAVADDATTTGVGLDDLARVVDYEALAVKVRALVAERHVRLIETLAERLALACLEDPRVHHARIRIEKLDIFPDAMSAGVEVERRRP